MPDEWADRINSTPIKSLLDQLRRMAVDGGQLADASENAISFFMRTQALTQHMQDRVAKADPRFVSVQAINNANSNLQSAIGAIQTYLSDRNDGNLSTATSELDNALVSLAPLPPLHPRVEAQTITKIARDTDQQLRELHSSAHNRLAKLAGTIAEQEGRLSSLAQEVETARQLGDTKAAEVTATFDQKISEARAEIDAQKARLDEAISQSQTQFAEAQERRLQEFNETQKSRDDSFRQSAAPVLGRTGRESQADRWRHRGIRRGGLLCE
jgi:hypothetical protein